MLFLKRIIIGCDNNALRLKKAIIELLETHNVEYKDIGVNDPSDDESYPEVAKRLCTEIIKSKYTWDGILMCGTGMGMSICANKFKGIYASVCHDIYSAERLRLSNNANVITFGEKVIGEELAKQITSRWLELEFKPSPSSEKIKKIKKYEEENFKNSKSS